MANPPSRKTVGPGTEDSLRELVREGNALLKDLQNANREATGLINKVNDMLEFAEPIIKTLVNRDLREMVIAHVDEKLVGIVGTELRAMVEAATKTVYEGLNDRANTLFRSLFLRLGEAVEISQTEPVNMTLDVTIGNEGTQYAVALIPDGSKKCWNCKRSNPEATALDGSGRSADEGDISVCIKCGAMHVFTGDGNMTRKPTRAEAALWTPRLQELRDSGELKNFSHAAKLRGRRIPGR